jgi:hypothetical protein
MPSVTTNVCSNFSAAAGDGIIWTDASSGCTITAEAGSPWPFTAGPPIILPSPRNPPATLKTGLTPGTYCFVVSCCKKNVVCVTIV